MTPDEKFIQWLKVGLFTTALGCAILWASRTYNLLVEILNTIKK